MGFHSIGTLRRISAQHVVAFYRPSDGRILHLHVVHILEGGREISRSEAEDEARVRAREMGRDLTQCEMFYSNELPEGGGPHKVDVGKGSLVTVERAQFKARRGRSKR
jgi:hypothetical protein